MRLINRNIIKFIIILTIMLCMEGGKTFALINHQIYCDLNLTGNNDSEISNHHHLFDSLEQESWNVPYSFSYTFPPIEVENQIISKPLATQELCNSIWQPPRLV